MSVFCELLRGLEQLVYPAACLLCDGPFDRHSPHSLCTSCTQSLMSDTLSACPRCCSTIGPHIALPDGCTHCKGERFSFDGAFRLGVYEGRLKEAVIRMKHHAGESLAETIGMLWAEHDRNRFEVCGPDVVVPVPLHWSRRVTRGYSQSAAVARTVADVIGRPFHDNWLKRVRPTPKQFAQTPSARRENLKDVFQTTRRCRVRDRRVLLIDDVLTTGATCSDAARALKAAGAAQVWVGVLAHR